MDSLVYGWKRCDDKPATQSYKIKHEASEQMFLLNTHTVQTKLSLGKKFTRLLSYIHFSNADPNVLTPVCKFLPHRLQLLACRAPWSITATHTHILGIYGNKIGIS